MNDERVVRGHSMFFIVIFANDSLLTPLTDKKMISRNLRVTLIEDDIVWGDREANIKQLERNLRNMPEDTDLVILPELFTTGFMTGDRDQAAAVAEWNSGDTLRILRKLADESPTATRPTMTNGICSHSVEKTRSLIRDIRQHPLFGSVDLTSSWWCAMTCVSRFSAAT